jgi:hypothetical protein
MWVGRADAQVKQVVMAYMGVQFSDEEQRPAALEALRHIVSSFDVADGPGNHDLTHHVDLQGHHNLIVVGYWTDLAVYDRWLSSSAVATWWESEERLSDGLGYFREVLAPRVEQFETLYAFQEACLVWVRSWARPAARSSNTATGDRCVTDSPSHRPTG